MNKAPDAASGPDGPAAATREPGMEGAAERTRARALASTVSGGRRRFGTVLAAVGAHCLLSAHSPYRQWVVYRQRFLLIHTHREDPSGDQFGEDLARVLLQVLPESRAQVVRGPTLLRIASLLSTQQADVAVLTREQSAAMASRSEPFGDLPPTALRVIVENDRHQFVCRDDFPARHAYLLAQALSEEAGDLKIAVPVSEEVGGGPRQGVPTHPGALAFARGEIPEPP
ncbi:MAG: hypothetical protein JNL33_02460 [Betaproteobacteria bacterium]|nr:hypothetical protein [Betaproteobacteria bacterium]